MTLTRIQNRRGTAAQWTAGNPILAIGEVGFETDTGKFKIGNGISNWTSLQYFLNIDAVKSVIVDSAPAALDTLNELSAALGDDQNFAVTILNAIADKAPIDSPTFTGTVDFSNSLVSGIILPINWLGQYSNTTNYVENDMIQYQGSVYYATGPNLDFVDNHYPTAPESDWELFASKGDPGPTGATGEQGPAGATGPAGADGGFNSTQVIANLSGGSYQLQASDAGKLFTNTGVPQPASVLVGGLSVGQQVDFVQTDTTQISFIANSPNVLYSKNSYTKTFTQYSPVSLKCIATDTYLLIGDIGA